jgi:hypothetical protein
VISLERALSQDSKRVEARTSSAYLMVLVAANHFAFRIGARSPVVGLALECFMVTCKDKYQHNKYDNFLNMCRDTKHANVHTHT